MLTVAELVKKFSAFTEFVDSSSCSQQLSSGADATSTEPSAQFV
jgi:hypothetical protein